MEIYIHLLGIFIGYSIFQIYWYRIKKDAEKDEKERRKRRIQRRMNKFKENNF